MADQVETPVAPEVKPVAPNAAPNAAPAKPNPLAPARARPPTADELKHTFSMDDAADLGIEQPSSESPKPKVPESKPSSKPSGGSEASAASGASELPLSEERSDERGRDVGAGAGRSEARPAATTSSGGMIMPPGKGGTPATRDLTGYTPEEQAVLKQMSNPAFDYVTKLKNENKELSKLRGAQFLQHPQAYTLDPEYRKMQEDNYYAQAEFQYWQAQLTKIKNGEDWQPIEGWEQNGAPRLGAVRPASSQDEEQIRLAMSKCSQIGEQINAQARVFVGNYGQRIQQDNQIIMQEQAKRFSWVADPKLLDEKLNINGTEKSIKDIKQEFINLFPAYHHNTVAVDVAANLFVASIIQGIRLEAAEAGRQVAEVKKDEVLRAEPTSAATRRPAGKEIGGVTEFSLKDFPV